MVLENIMVIGNIVIDVLLDVSVKFKNDIVFNSEMEECFSFLNKDKKLILVMGYRRESFGGGFECICKVLVYIVE